MRVPTAASNWADDGHDVHCASQAVARLGAPEEPLRGRAPRLPGIRWAAPEPRRRPIVADACRSVTGRRKPEIISAVRKTAARAALTMATMAALTTGCATVLDQVAVTTGGGPVLAAPAAASGDAALRWLPCRSRAAPRRPDTTATQFGPAWADVDRNGCDTRNDILTRDLDARRSSPAPATASCSPARSNDPYTGKTIAFVRGQGTSSAVQIDHVVALSDAWQKGAQQLTAERAATFANDPLNLLAVDGRDQPERATATRRPGCRRTSASAARTSPGRSR